MKFGVRECANIVFRAKTPTNIGKYKFQPGQPVLYIDTATTSSVEQSTTTVYAQGGRGNVRLVSWEGEKTLTFTVEDALLSPISLAMLSGADLFQGSDTVKTVHFHTTSTATLKIQAGTGSDVYGYVDLSSVLGAKETLCPTNDSPIYVIFTEGDGSLTGEMVLGEEVKVGSVEKDAQGNITSFTPGTESSISQVIQIKNPTSAGLQSFASGEAHTLTSGNAYSVFVDYYLDKNATAVDELQIAADNFAGNYYVEADTLFRRKSDGVDMPANLTFPNVKIQSNLTFQLSGTGDPSTFTFTMDALPGYTYFDKSREVMCVIQVIEDQTNADKVINPVMPHNESLEHEIDEIADSRYIGFGGNTPTNGNMDIVVKPYVDAPIGSSTLSVVPTLVGAPTGTAITGSSYISSDATNFAVSTAGVVSVESTVTAGAKAIISVSSTVTGGKVFNKDVIVTAVAAG